MGFFLKESSKSLRKAGKKHEKARKTGLFGLFQGIFRLNQGKSGLFRAKQAGLPLDQGLYGLGSSTYTKVWPLRTHHDPAAADLSFWGLGIITLGLELIGNDEINYFEKE